MFQANERCGLIERNCGVMLLGKWSRANAELQLHNFFTMVIWPLSTCVMKKNQIKSIYLSSRTWGVVAPSPKPEAHVLNIQAFQIELEFRRVGFWGEGKTRVPEKKNLGAEKRRSQIWHRLRKLNPGHIAGGWVLSPLSHPCSPNFNVSSNPIISHCYPE